jgi:hypothetical protein
MKLDASYLLNVTKHTKNRKKKGGRMKQIQKKSTHHKLDPPHVVEHPKQY